MPNKIPVAKHSSLHYEWLFSRAKNSFHVLAVLVGSHFRGYRVTRQRITWTPLRPSVLSFVCSLVCLPGTQHQRLNRCRVFIKFGIEVLHNQVRSKREFHKNQWYSHSAWKSKGISNRTFHVSWPTWMKFVWKASTNTAEPLCVSWQTVQWTIFST
jgi:hypothetical protein